MSWMGSSGTTQSRHAQQNCHRVHLSPLSLLLSPKHKQLISEFHQWHDLQLCFSHSLSWNPLRRKFCCQDKNVDMLHFLCWSPESASVSSPAVRPTGHLFLARSGKQVIQGGRSDSRSKILKAVRTKCNLNSISEYNKISPFWHKTHFRLIFKFPNILIIAALSHLHFIRVYSWHGILSTKYSYNTSLLHCKHKVQLLTFLYRCNSRHWANTRRDSATLGGHGSLRTILMLLTFYSRFVFVWYIYEHLSDESLPLACHQSLIRPIVAEC